MLLMPRRHIVGAALYYGQRVYEPPGQPRAVTARTYTAPARRNDTKAISLPLRLIELPPPFHAELLGRLWLRKLTAKKPPAPAYIELA